MKQTSATGYLRNSENPNKRLQDGVKKYLLCETCDNNLISGSEKYFIENIFAPYLKDRHITLSYNSKLHHFAASLALRVILTEEEESSESNDRGIEYSALVEPREYLSRYLLGKTQDMDELEHYIILTNELSNYSYTSETKDGVVMKRDIHQDLNYHFLRRVDFTLIYIDDHLITLSLMPGFIFYTIINPRKYAGNLGRSISSSDGMLKYEESVMLNHDLFEYHLESALRRPQNISQKQVDVINKSIKKNPDRWQKSESKRFLGK